MHMAGLEIFTSLPLALIDYCLHTNYATRTRSGSRVMASESDYANLLIIYKHDGVKEAIIDL